MFNIDCSDITFDGTIDGSTDDGQLVIVATEDDYTSGDITPGTYIIEITGTADESTGPVTETTTIKITFTDPCDPPRFITAPAMVDQKYTLNSLSTPYIHPVFSVTPSYCPVTYDYSITDLTSVPVTAISRNEQQFNFYYDN